ncbi:hypothetical protein [Brucella sp. JSBI001]|uniref:hypothetical protein n=1 Tax=Brucella sp. JSBI001 TaxID=2886044 RepID=UPI00222EDF0D|nr:hypothetical protein [Brucella sp. JSBI001]UZD70896.1 hypothetical protein LJ361_05620 [Brucella sp. JSBI001]
MLAGIKVPTVDGTNKPMSDSERLDWLRTEAAKIRQAYENHRISEAEAVRQLNQLIADERSFLRRLFGF